MWYYGIIDFIKEDLHNKIILITLKGEASNGFSFLVQKAGGEMSYVKKNSVGRPPKYTSKEEIEGLIDRYFETCKGELLKDEKGEYILNKAGEPIIVNRKPPTVTGLALALGFKTRQSLLDYQSKKEFLDTITRAKTKVEEYAEIRLFDRDGVNGAKFSLINNFKNWHERPVSENDIEEQQLRIKLQKIKMEILKAKSEIDKEETEDDGFIDAIMQKVDEIWQE